MPLNSARSCTSVWIRLNWVSKSSISTGDGVKEDKQKAVELWRRASVLEKAKVIGYTRMLRRTIKRHPENTALIDYCKEQLIELVDKTDSLAI